MRKDIVLFCFVFSLCLIKISNGGKILYYFPVCPRSVQITFIPIVERLIERGHEVTVIGPFPTGISNITEIIWDKKGTVLNLLNKVSEKKLTSESNSFQSTINFLSSTSVTNEEILIDKEVAALIANPKTKFDVVVTFPLLSNAVGAYLAHRFEAKLIYHVSIQLSFSLIDDMLGQPHNSAFSPMVFFPFGTEMTFFERVTNAVATKMLALFCRFYLTPSMDKLIDKHIPQSDQKPRPPLSELQKNVSLAFHFGHPLIGDGSRPVLPHYIYVGMMNCQKPNFEKNMSPDIKKYMDDAKEGVIFVSFGSALQASKMSEEKRTDFITVFSKLKQRVIWKWETETMPDAPSNLKLVKWLPQKEILAHPNLKMFISHAGQSSFQETLCFQKPALFIPVHGDQMFNAQEGAVKGFGRALPFSKVSSETLYDGITSILNDPSYTEKAKYWGALIMDQIESPLDRAVWWMEYVIRHKSSLPHFKSPGEKLNFFQLNLIDVYGFLIFCALALSFLFLMLIRLCCRCCGWSKEKKD